MSSITVKSTGTLIDELITTHFKIEVNPSTENIQRALLLETAIRIRLDGNEEQIALQVIKLRTVLRECWNSQEVVMQYKDLRISDNLSASAMVDWIRVGQAGLTAQRTNAVRNKIIREIDTILGEDTTPLGKTYG